MGDLLASFAEVRVQRSVIFFALGGIIGLATAGYGLFTAQGTTTHSIPPEDVALINQRPILRSDYIAQLQQIYNVGLADSTKAQRDKILADMIHEELFVQRGLELDMPSSDPDTRNALVAAVDQQVVADVTTQEPTDAKLQAYYTAHQADYSTEGSMTVHDLVRTPADASALDAAAQALRQGTKLATVLTTYGLAESGRVSGEEFYFAAKIHLGEALFEAAAKLSDHGVSVVGGTHLLVMERNLAPVAQSFAAAREQVLNNYRRDEIARLTASENKFLQDRADILLAPDFK